MKNYKITIPAASKKTIRAIEMILVDGGFVTERKDFTKEVEFTIEANHDTEFADLFIEVGQTMIKNFPA